MSNFESLRDIMATTLDVEPERITETAAMDDIDEWDSLGHVPIMVALETGFDLYLDVEDFAELTTVPQILQFLEAQ